VLDVVKPAGGQNRHMNRCPFLALVDCAALALALLLLCAVAGAVAGWPGVLGVVALWAGVAVIKPGSKPGE
jgi:hypothetical protein